MWNYASRQCNVNQYSSVITVRKSSIDGKWKATRSIVEKLLSALLVASMLSHIM